MCTVCIQAKHKQKFIKVPVKSTMKPFELVHWDVCGPFSTPTFGDNRYYILFIDDYTRYTSVWLFPNKRAKTCTSAYQSFQAWVDSMGYEIKQLRCDNGQGEYEIETFRYVLAARGTTYRPCPPYAHHKNVVAELVLATGPGNPPAFRVWTAKTGRFGSRTVQKPDPLTLGGPNPDLYPSTRGFRRV